MAVKAPSDEVQRVISLALDAAFYRTIYGDVTAEGEALGHYARHGWREGRDPAPWFSGTRYLEANPDIAKAGVEPLHHYLTRGRYEGREVYPSVHAHRYFEGRLTGGEPVLWRLETPAAAEPAVPPPEAVPEAAPEAAPEAPAHAAPNVVAEMTYADRRAAERVLVGPEFDAAYYLGMNPDVAEAGTDPLEHFLMAGWREGRDPNAWFSVRDYLETNPDIVQAGDNPFVHYVMAGRSEGRAAKQDLGFRYDVLAGLVPVGERVARASAATAAVKLGTAKALAAGLAAARTGLKDLHVTFSHDDYTAHLGGVQLCLQREAARIGKLGRDHLHIHPAVAWPVVRTRGERGALGVLLNGRALGVYSGAVIARALGEAAGPAGARSFAIHSLLGHGAEETVKILAAVGLKAGYFWLHDFASLCAGFHLLRDDVEDCAAPPPQSPACNVCVYGPWRARHLAEHGKLFKALDLTVVSPSQPTLDLWRAAWTFPTKGEVVAPHARLVRRGPSPITDGPFRLGFAGLTAAHKGWPVFRELALKFAHDPRYQFIHFGLRSIGGLPIDFKPVRVNAERPKAMQQALESAQVDAVLVWPLCRETFSFTAYEAVAAGAAVVTNPDSGNVAAFVHGGGHGRVLADEAALAELLASGEILALARSVRKPSLYDLKFSGLTVDLLDRARAA
ncbi:hypothetical protein [Phenylobacterium sp.]|uniref:hypothetical protein n=1 Tax=Phenylobacterium sp. TaxID=1871053 RepID=UPI002DF2ED36|nr:hypothetical protein [Phenylobacterium sp.]